MESENTAIDDAVQRIAEGELDIDPDEYRSVISGLRSSGFTADEARIYAAKSMSSADFPAFKDALGITDSEYHAAIESSHELAKEARERFIQLFDGPKVILATLSGTGESKDEDTGQMYVFRYVGESDRTPSYAEYGVLIVNNRDPYYLDHSFDSGGVSLERYRTLDDLIGGFYNDGAFWSMKNAYKTREALIEEGVDPETLPPASEQALIRDGQGVKRDQRLHIVFEVTDRLERMADWDGLIELGGEFVEVSRDSDGDTFTVRTEIGDEVTQHPEKTVAEMTAELYRDVGPAPTKPRN